MKYSLKTNEVNAICFDGTNMTEFICKMTENYRLEISKLDDKLTCVMTPKFNNHTMQINYGDYIVNTGENRYCVFNSIDFERVFETK